MKRDVYQDLVNWKKSHMRKPVILRGSRQVGKTYILRKFAESEFSNYVYLDFENDPALDSEFSHKFDIERLITFFEIYCQAKIKKGKTLIIFDEIQASPNALNSLKYFKEYASEYHVAAAGSLLGVQLSTKSSFPVGKVDFIDMYPLNFKEFLSAIGKQELRKLIEEKKAVTPFPETFHIELIDLLKKYFFIGGMPEAVAGYKNKESFITIRQLQRNILDSYLSDFAKHSGKADAMKITKVWQSIPRHLSRENRKFTFSAIKNSARARDYESAIQWLLNAGLIYLSYDLSKPGFPLSAYRNERIFKVYMFDIGLLGAMSKLDIGIIIKGNEIFSHYCEALTENYVAQQLFPKFKRELYYWTSNGKAEVDFVFPYCNAIYPLEVKAGKNLKSKSLKVYAQKFAPGFLSFVGAVEMNKERGICNYPLYAISSFPLTMKNK